jgi:hypothetical protein
MGVGQFLGPKVKVKYIADSGEAYLLTRDADLCGTAIEKVSLPVWNGTDEISFPPPRFKPRGCYWKSDAAPFYRKFLICGTQAAEAYDATAPIAITIDGIAGKTTGVRGERFTY